MKKTKKSENPKAKSVSEAKEQPEPKSSPKGFGILGKDLSSKFSSRGDRAWRPKGSGGRNGQGKP